MSERKKSNSEKCKGRGNKFFWGAIIIIVVLIVFSILNGHASHNSDRHSSHWRGGSLSHGSLSGTIFSPSDWVFKKADLTEEQLEKIKAVLDEFTAEMKEFRVKNKDLKKQFVVALEADQVRAEDLLMIQTDYVNLFDQASSKMVDAVLKVSEGLTPEQRKDLMKSVSTHRKRR
jgi:Spy/CpxP family protein refolding chaperone